MGVEARKPPLPAPTDSPTFQNSGGSVTGTDLATDISRRTDRTSYSVPEDGSPITISTKKRREKRDKDHEGTLTRAAHQSQTSLLIEYFEGGKGPNVHSRPSVRVKVTPSAARKIKDTNEHIQITEAGGHRKPSYTRRISLGPKAIGDKHITESADEKSISSYISAEEESSLAERYPPVEIEVMHRDQGSDLSGGLGPAEQRYIQQNASEVSSMPPDSMLEGTAGNLTPRRDRSRSTSKGAVITTTDTLKTPSRRGSRSLSRERITQKAIEKIKNKPRDASSSKRRHGSKTRSRSVSNEQAVESVISPKRRSSRYQQEEEFVSGAESSLLTSQASTRRKSGDQYSFRSGTSNSSIKNPKLLETVEDAIRRLILPELTTLKEEQKLQQNRNKFERNNPDSTASGSSPSRTELIRRVSKHASAPDVKTRPKVVLNRDEHNAGTVLSGNSIKGRKESGRDNAFDSPTERSFERDVSEETVIRDDGTARHHKNKDGHRHRDAAVGALVGGALTAAALRHHDSKSSIDKRERRRKRSKSHSRSASVAESTDEIFYKHEVPPMPMRSEIQGSEVTRDSILSEQTEGPASPSMDRRRTEIREVSRGSPREVLSPAQRTPTRTPVGKGLGTHHSNLSRGDLSVHSANSERSLHMEEVGPRASDFSLGGAAVGAGTLAEETFSHNHDRYTDQDERVFAHRAHNQGLSPIQSVASFQEERDLPNQDMGYTRSSGSLSSLNQNYRRGSALSIKSLSSVGSKQFPPSNRPKGINLERGEDVLGQHGLQNSDATQGEYDSGDPAMDEWYERQHEENNRYRESTASENDPDATIDIRHLTNYTDDSMDAPYLDKVTAAQHVRGMGANAEFVRTPIAVESAVASLHDPSVLSVRSKAGSKSYVDSFEEDRPATPDLPRASDKEFGSEKHGGNVDDQGDTHTQGYKSEKPREHDQRSAADSPRQSIARSEDGQVPMGVSGLPVADDPIPEIGHGLDSDESDLNTNPSIIQGPIGGLHHGSRDHWPSQPTPPRSGGEPFSHSNDHSAHESLKAAAAGMLSAATLARRDQEYHDGQDNTRDVSFNGKAQPTLEEEYAQDVIHDYGPNRDSYMTGMSIPTPPMAKDKDEGYISAAPQHSPGPNSPEDKHWNGAYEANRVNDTSDFMADDDPFVSNNKSHARHLSANSHGMPSPLYDSAMGRGIDRIQSKDVVALMDHLTVRDAQRNARDTEILVTLVRSAAEMRNSFEDMKRFIAEQDDVIMDTGNKQHDRTIQKIIGGPRPQPLGAPRASRQLPAEDDEDMRTKRRSVFRRALKGLSGRSTNDLGKIEDMLVQLLGEVEGLKAAQDIRPNGTGARPESLSSYDNARAVGQDGYEPEGQAGTSSTGHSGYFSNPPSRQQNGRRSQDVRHGSRNRVSTVLEGDEELEAHEQNVLDHQFDNDDKLLTPTRDYARGTSVPLDTPPQVHIPTGAQSNENTPKTATDKSRKHKSSSSSFFPKISRWSKTTASSMGDNVRNSGRKERPYSEASRSGSDLHYDNDHYDPHGDDRIRSNDSFQNPLRSNRPPSPLVPSQVSEDPKYQAHRNSLNLQHPQPRPGPTHRYQTHLESQAHNFGSPISPTSDQWGSNPTLARFPPGPGNRFSGGAGNLSPISDGGYSETSAVEKSNAPPRPPKVRDDGPLIPAQPPKLASKDNRPAFASPLSSEFLQPEQRYSNASSGADLANGSPRSASGSTPQRKPTGPRPITTSGNYSPDKISNIQRKRYRGSPNHISSAEDVTF